jgi:hypothetical protein
MDHAPPEARRRADDVLEDWSPPALDILWAIAQWYNGAVLERDNQRYHIGWHRPPDLQTLLGCSDAEWEQRYEAAFTDLQAPATSPTLVDDRHHGQSEESQPWLTEQYILRRKVRWTPTRTARTAMDTLFAGLFDADDLPQHQLEADTGLVGDWDESLLHRTGVAVVAAVWRQQGRSVELYPGEQGKAQPDVRSTALDGTTWEAEVLTDHHDRAMPRSKFATFAEQSERQHLWIFENRETAFETLNRLHEAGDVDCRIANAPFDTPENYSIQVGNRYLDQSHTDADYHCPGIDRIDTITGLYERFYDDAMRARLAEPSTTTHS